jgi:hypothetical protein
MSTAPTPKQSGYFARLVVEVAAKEDTDENGVYESLGLIESNAWGGRMREEVITKANMSRWIDQLKARTEAATINT